MAVRIVLLLSSLLLLVHLFLPLSILFCCFYGTDILGVLNTKTAKIIFSARCCLFMDPFYNQIDTYYDISILILHLHHDSTVMPEKREIKAFIAASYIKCPPENT